MRLDRFRRRVYSLHVSDDHAPEPVKNASNTAGLRRNGRPKGAQNKVTKEIRALSSALFDEKYWRRTKIRLNKGTLPPQIEVKLLAYAYGEPKQTLDVPQLAGFEVWARKVVHELHPGPTTTPTT